jgi:DNA-binding CsgD family transcriptional regulator
MAHRFGAVALAEESRAELIASGARPRRPATRGVDALTPGERRVAGMAASGMSNREIAEDLFVTPKAVQWHLRNAYRKLGIAGRGELNAALGASSRG